jgi:hypothetical protein
LQVEGCRSVIIAIIIISIIISIIIMIVPVARPALLVPVDRPALLVDTLAVVPRPAGVGRVCLGPWG